ncbi:MAG: hypothetical protein KG012_03765 [Deltaproteobacteria bacterium]|nr:hypothetical protein [Deltaproteobacteria bacterium]
MPLLVLSLILLISTPSFCQTLSESTDQIWEVGDRRWTIEEERRFEKWVEETITEDFFIPYKIPTDCADAVYAIRWIYARIAHLPAAATTKDGKLVGHWSTDWKHLPTHPEWHQDKRFRAVLFYLFPRTWTGTLPLDTYPVRISTDSVTPGTLFLETESHTGMIRRVFLDGSQTHPLQTWESALPVKVQKLSMKYFFSARPDFRTGSGLVKFRWPVFENGKWGYLPVKEHPFYSEEQYTLAFSQGHAGFAEAVARRIDPTHYPPEEKLVKVLGTLNRYLKERARIVLEGYRQCQNDGCVEGSEGWELHHTSGRDGMIISLMDHLSQVIGSNHLDQEKIKKRMEAVSIKISENRSISLYDIYQNHLWFSPHPSDSIEARWGLKKCEMIQAQTLATNKSIAFIEKTYRKKDPQYADFSIRQQRHLLARLSEEWNRSECKEPLPILAKKDPVLPHPKKSPEPRLDSKKCQKIRTEIQATHDSIAFIERTYGKKDPEYAYFSIRQQQHILTRLREEWNHAECKGPIPFPEQKMSK